MTPPNTKKGCFMNTILILLSPDQLSDVQKAEIQRIAPDKKLLLTQDHDEIEAHAEWIEIAVGWVPRNLLYTLKNLRWFQQWGAGADWLLDHPDLVKKDFILTSASGVHAVPISEHILSLLLAFARGLPKAIKAQEQKCWLRHQSLKLFELAGKTMLLIGVGAIGERTAEISAGLGMRVLGVRRNSAIAAPSVEEMFSPAQLLNVLPRADFVVLTIPLTRETRWIIGEPQLRVMKSSAVIINIGRGGTIQETALIQALESGWIAGAGLDVFEHEPLPVDSPLWEMDNVIITSHYSGLTPHYAERAVEIFTDNLRRYQTGEPLHNVVEKDLGY
jgi:D-2-hydroxyacid dehydrogenase (NADP+)